MPENAASDNLVPPDLQVRYSDLSFIGKGGMGRVIGAHDSHLNRKVAIKLLPANSEDPLAVMRFQQEARAVSKLNNPHIVQVLDFGYAESGEPFLVMERVHGQDLESRLELKGAMSIPDAIKIAVQLCDALEHAHSNEVVHRDLKPGNIMLDENHTVRVLDFGLARILNMDETDWRLTRPGQPLGSILYMSPEQMRGQEADERSDVFSLGLVILKMVNGELPYEGLNTMKILTMRLDESPLALPESDDMSDLRHCVHTVINKAISPNADQRYKSMREFKDALLGVEHAAKRRAEARARATLPVSKKVSKRKIVVAASIALVAITSGTIYYLNSLAVLEKKKQEQKVQQEMQKPKPVEPATMTSRQLILAREALFSNKFDQRNGCLYAHSNVIDSDLALLAGLPYSDVNFEANHKISAAGLAHLTAMPNLRTLSLRLTDIGDEGIPVINKMKSLGYLDLFGSKMTDKGIQKLSPSLPLTHLDLKNLLYVGDPGLRYVVETYPNLDVISIGGTSVTEEGFKLIAKLKKLRNLGANALDLTDDDLLILQNLPIETLDLTKNLVTYKSFALFKRMKTLKSINLEVCAAITEPQLDELRKTMHVRPEKNKKLLDPEMEQFYSY